MGSANITKFLKRMTMIRIMVISVLAVGSVSTARGEEVVLNPGFITGTIGMGSQPVRWATASATFQNFSASTPRIFNTNGTSVDYNLTVNVPEGTTPTYRMGATLALMSSNGT